MQVTEAVLIARSPSPRARVFTFVRDDDEAEGVLRPQKPRPR
jgi:hypothetical protein